MEPKSHLVYDAPEDVSEQTVRMHADEDSVALFDIALHKRDMSFAAHLIFEGRYVELPINGGHAGLSGEFDQNFILHSITDQVGDRDDLQVVQSRKLFKLRQAGHCAVVVHYFADDACRSESRDAGYIDACFGLSGTNEHASAPSAQRKSMAGSRQIRRSGFLVDCRKN